jgi:hypothetical protein
MPKRRKAIEERGDVLAGKHEQVLGRQTIGAQ